MYFKTDSFHSEKFYVRWLLLILAGLILCNISCQKKVVPQIPNVSEADVKEEISMGDG